MNVSVVGVYARISEDAELTGLGVARQQSDCEGLARVRGWDIGRVYIDNDLSAFKRKVVRPEFEQMLADLKTGAIDGIVVYDLDRFVRQPRDLERAIELYEEANRALVFASVQGDINLQTADGKTMARVLVAFANKASMDTSRRVQRQALESAREGKPVGGRRPFGWKADKLSLDPVEARLVRRAVADVLAGSSMSEIVRRWGAAGVTTSAGKAWRLTTLRQYLKSPRLVGDRVHQGRVLLDEHGRPVRGLWEPMLDRDTHDRLLGLLGANKRPRNPGRKGSRRYLLSGVARCGVCSAVMYGAARSDLPGVHVYQCRDVPAGRHSNTISGRKADRLIRDLCLAKLAEDQGPVEVEWDGEAELAETQEQIDTLMTAFMEKRLSGPTVLPRVSALEEKVAEMQESRVRWLQATTGPASRALSVEEWDELSTDVQRAHVERLLEAVLIRPSVKPQNRLDPQRVVPVPRAARPALHAVHG